MILSDTDIRKAIKSGEITIESPYDLYIGPASLDLHLSGIAQGVVKYNHHETIMSCEKDNSENFSRVDFERLMVRPGDFYILSTEEYMRFGRNIVGFIQGRSSIARLGLHVHAAGYFDPEFEGTATLEITNPTNFPIVIKRGMRICQMVFSRTVSGCTISYKDKRDQKYFGQREPGLSQIHKDEK